ncbi:hypothetical protein DFR52_1011081 [Hoeflea marina]|uniref:Lipoprotein n=1 Tax=Hoeflea marina TaxID=274592 RepID=A0A317PSE6_9HYPH|nr:hypothetical protein [Hoeflea marina]PWW04383.1 hypothetical protein DFR52_1011081 [Hoeflea marina]
MRRLALPALVAALMLSACNTGPKPSGGAPSAHSQAVALLQRVNSSAHDCWLKDADFAAYGIVPELDTSATPRLLLVPRGKPQALPNLVIAASGRSVQTYGPLAQSALAPRINADVARWAGGSKDCRAAA